MRGGGGAVLVVVAGAAALVRPPFQAGRLRVAVRRGVDSSEVREEALLAECEAYLEEIGGPEAWKTVLTRFDEQVTLATRDAHTPFWPLTASTLVPRWREVSSRRANASAWREEVRDYAKSFEEEKEAMNFFSSIPVASSIATAAAKFGLPLELASAGDNETRYSTLILYDVFVEESEARIRGAVRAKLKDTLTADGLTLDYIRKSLGLNETASDDDVLDAAIDNSPNFMLGELLTLVVLAIFALGLYDAASSFFHFLGFGTDAPATSTPQNLFADTPAMAPSNPGEAGLNALLNAFQKSRP